MAQNKKKQKKIVRFPELETKKFPTFWETLPKKCFFLDGFPDRKCLADVKYETRILSQI